MNIFLNDEQVDFSLETEKTLGDVLAQLDAWLEKSGLAILRITLDGATISPESFAGRIDTPVAIIKELKLEAGNISNLRYSVLNSAKTAIETMVKDMRDGNMVRFHEGIRTYPEILDSFNNLFSRDEIAFLDYLPASLFHGTVPDDFGDKAETVIAILKERMSEIKHPAREILETATIFDNSKKSLTEIPLLLQTGRDKEAMKTVFLFTEIMGKLLRILPELTKSQIEIAPENDPGAFYSGMNEILKTMMTAFENKDSVLVGDLAEYEIVPRLETFFQSARKALEVKV